jgi:hypothetical protein
VSPALPDFTAYTEVERGYETPCWVPPQVPNSAGYVQIPNGRGGRQLAHRAFHERFVGSIPEGHEVDHLCEQHDCCSPAHLEAVPPSVNRLRSKTPPSLNVLKTHCPYGHPYDEANTYVTPAGYRQCRICTRRRNREAAARRKVAA